jgi:hypothetical protein
LTQWPDGIVRRVPSQCRPIAHPVAAEPVDGAGADPVQKALQGPGPSGRPGAGLGLSENHYQHAAPGHNEHPRLLLRCHEAQRGATSSIRKTAGLTFGTTYVT